MIYDDPCATAVQLRAAYLAIIKGQGAQRVIIEGGGGKQDTTFHKADIAALRQELRNAETACAQLSGPDRPRRFAIRGG